MSYQLAFVSASFHEGQMSQSSKECRQPLQPFRIYKMRWYKPPEGTIVGRSPGMTCLQSRQTSVIALAADNHQQHSQLHVCLTSLMFLRSQTRTLSKAVPSRPPGSPAQSLLPSKWSCISSGAPDLLGYISEAVWAGLHYEICIRWGALFWCTLWLPAVANCFWKAFGSRLLSLHVICHSPRPAAGGGMGRADCN